MKRLLKYLFAALIISNIGYSQTEKDSSYDYVKAFETAFYSAPSTETRSASGKPGHKYWQNKADLSLIHI